MFCAYVCMYVWKTTISPIYTRSKLSLINDHHISWSSHKTPGTFANKLKATHICCILKTVTSIIMLFNWWKGKYYYSTDHKLLRLTNDSTHYANIFQTDFFLNINCRCYKPFYKRCHVVMSETWCKVLLTVVNRLRSKMVSIALLMYSKSFDDTQKKLGYFASSR